MGIGIAGMSIACMLSLSHKIHVSGHVALKVLCSLLCSLRSPSQHIYYICTYYCIGNFFSFPFKKNTQTEVIMEKSFANAVILFLFFVGLGKAQYPIQLAKTILLSYIQVNHSVILAS